MTGIEPTPSPVDPVLARRRVLVGGLGVAGVAVLAGCGDEDTPSGSADPTEESGPTEPEATEPEETSPAPEGGAGTDLGPATEVAVGSGAIFAEQKVVVTQPTAGEFRAFDTTCTHAGCPVEAVTETISCPCHGSQFSIEDGSVVSGPATEPLAAKDVAVENGTLRLL